MDQQTTVNKMWDTVPYTDTLSMVHNKFIMLHNAHCKYTHKSCILHAECTPCAANCTLNKQKDMQRARKITKAVGDTRRQKYKYAFFIFTSTLIVWITVQRVIKWRAVFIQVNVSCKIKTFINRNLTGRSTWSFVADGQLRIFPNHNKNGG